MEEKYNAGLMAQSFWFIEFKKIVVLYRNGADYDEIKHQCIEENLFGAINPTREKRMCGYLLTRLKSMDERLIDIFVNADVSTQKLINLITVMNINRLFFEFVYEVYRNKLIVGDTSIGSWSQASRILILSRKPVRTTSQRFRADLQLVCRCPQPMLTRLSVREF